MADYVVIHKDIIRVMPDKSTVRFYVGDEIDPTEEELLEYPEQLKKIDRVVPGRERQAMEEPLEEEDVDGAKG